MQRFESRIEEIVKEKCLLRMYGDTHVGVVRDHNEDAFWYDKDTGIAIVSDGMGGHACGEVASAIAISTFKQVVADGISKAGSADDIKQLIHSFFHEANNQVVRYISEESSKEGMGATVVICIEWKDMYFIAHAGDSRAYLVRNRSIHRITKDHSYIQQLLDENAITEQMARTHPMRNVITRSIGASNDDVCEITVIEKEKSDCIVLCTDGLSGVLTDEHIASIVLGHAEFVSVVDQLIHTTVANGAPDNVTVVIIGDDTDRKVVAKIVQRPKKSHTVAVLLIGLCFLSGVGLTGWYVIEDRLFLYNGADTAEPPAELSDAEQVAAVPESTGIINTSLPDSVAEHETVTGTSLAPDDSVKTGVESLPDTTDVSRN